MIMDTSRDLSAMIFSLQPLEDKLPQYMVANKNEIAQFRVKLFGAGMPYKERSLPEQWTSYRKQSPPAPLK